MSEFTVVKTISHYKHVFIVPTKDLEELINEPVDGSKIIDKFSEYCVDEIYQEHLGEEVIDLYKVDEKDAIILFKSYNSGFNWPDSTIIKVINRFDNLEELDEDE